MKSQKLITACLFTLLITQGCSDTRSSIQTVTGPIDPDKLGVTLTHEHVLVDFIGADSVSPARYNEEEVFQRVLPFLLQLKESGCQAMFECTPDYLGRDPFLLKRLSMASGVLIITNTGYYGAAKQKFFPKQVFTETSEQLADRWIHESQDGIGVTGIRPGFIKLSADAGALTEYQRKVVKAGAICHLATGLTISIHSGDGTAAREELDILTQAGVDASAFIWIHAQNEKDFSVFKEIAGKGAWVEFDGLGPESIEQHLALVKFMKSNGLLSQTLVSHDAGWYNVGSPNGGDFRPYTTLFSDFIPGLASWFYGRRDRSAYPKKPGPGFHDPGAQSKVGLAVRKLSLQITQINTEPKSVLFRVIRGYAFLIF